MGSRGLFEENSVKNKFVENAFDLEINYSDREESFLNPLNIILSQSGILSSNREKIEQALDYKAEKEQTDSKSEAYSEVLPFYNESTASASSRNDTEPDGDEMEEYILNEYALDADAVEIRNKTGYEIDVEALLSETLNINLRKGEPEILIIHTHGSEAYTPAGDDIYEESDPSRTEDKNYNMIRAGNVLAEALEECGLNVIHDTELYDYPSYTGSYSRSYEAIQSYIEEYPTIQIVIDLHRNAMENQDGTAYKSTVEFEGKKASQVMLVVGSDASGLEHMNWRENMKFALHLQCAMQSRYPNLAQPVSVSEYRYNQHATPGSLIVEIGYNGNTLEEALNAVRLFSKCAADVILPLEREME